MTTMKSLLSSTSLVPAPVRTWLLPALLCLNAAIIAIVQFPARASFASQEPITPVRAELGQDPRRVALGMHLFHNARLSRGAQRSCASCHDTWTNGASAVARDMSPDGVPLAFNTPTVFNAAKNFRFNWRGSSRSLEDQVWLSLQSRDAMATNEDEILASLRGDREMARQFRDAYRRAPQLVDVLDAIAAYIRSLSTPDSRFDRWLAGDSSAMTQLETTGYQLFKSLGCVSCHQGANVGGNLFQRSGIFRQLSVSQPGVLRVPSLRNVATTAPYFHDGSAATLADAVREMALAQLDRELTEEQTAAIVAFLQTLTGSYRGLPIVAPAPAKPP